MTAGYFALYARTYSFCVAVALKTVRSCRKSAAPMKEAGADTGNAMMNEKHRLIRPVLAGAVLLASLSALRAEDKFPAREMLSSCQPILDSAKTAKSLDELELENTFTSGTCWGAFLSVQQFVITRVKGGKNTMLQTCVPPETTLVQIIQVFDLFVRSNPKRQDEPFTKVAIAALRSAFPCK